jgi:hypothetical protein
MADNIQEKAEKRLKDGWIKTWMMIEALAVSPETVNKALNTHIERMEKEDKFMIIKKDFKETKKTDSPFEDVKEAHSGVVEIEVLTENFDKLFYMVINYGPSAVEILAPEKITLDMGELQGMLNSMADIIHRFAARMGGMTINT